MIISKVYIKNFRSINEVKLELSNYSVIFGKNNEGKSNIMRAIYRGWTLLEDFSNHNHNAVRLRHNKNGFKIRTRGNLISNTSKEVEDDITKDSDDKNNLIQIGYYFDLSDEEYIEINKSMNSKTKITKKIYVEIQYDDSLFYKCRVKLNSNGNFLSSPKNILASIIFIQKKFDIDYIPSIRTEETATEIVQNAVKERLKDLTLRDEYNEAINLINQLQDQELKKIASQIEPDLKRYLKNIKSVEVVSLRSDRPLIRYGYSNDIDININDGRLTSIKNKGDGIKSLIALSILQTSESNNRLLMIDEPESHLHSGAIRELKSKIMSDTLNHQTLICSHHQIFVDRNTIKNNKLLNGGKINEKIDIRKIRQELGVSLGENLLSAEIVLLVEGETDKSIIEMYIKNKRTDLQNLLEEGIFIIDSVRGVSKIDQKISVYESGLCNVVALLDNDEAVKSNKTKINLDKSNYFLVPTFNKIESEIEDIFEKDFIFKVVDEQFGLNNSYDKKRMGKKKFTNGLKAILHNKGKIFEKEEEEQFKWRVISRLKEEENLPINPIYNEFLESVCDRISALYFKK